MSLRAQAFDACCAAAALVLLAACSSGPADADVRAMATPMTEYLAQNGDLCLAKTHWPIDVPADEAGERSRNGVQMPVLAQAGLVSATPVIVDAREERPAGPGMRYALTDEGRKYLRARRPLGDGSSSGSAPTQDFCAAHLSLDKVVAVQPSQDDKGRLHALVTYTYRIEPAPWTSDAAVQHAFPMVERVVRGAGAMQLQQRFMHTANGWVAERA